MAKAKKNSPTLLVSEASKSCKRRKILNGNPPTSEKRQQNSPGKNSASSTSLAPFIHVGARVCPVLTMHGWEDTGNEEQGITKMDAESKGAGGRYQCLGNE